MSEENLRDAFHRWHRIVHQRYQVENECCGLGDVGADPAMFSDQLRQLRAAEGVANSAVLAMIDAENDWSLSQLQKLLR